MKPRTFKTEAGMQAFLDSRPTAAYHVLVLHDESCSPGRCTCRPWYEVRELTTDNVLEGQRLQDEWSRRSSS